MATRYKILTTKYTDSGAPEGFLLNGKIEVTDASGITVAIKTLAGDDPTTSTPVSCRIGGTVRSITSALSVVKADGTNWCDAGSSELATKEIDYFVYLGYNATDGVVIGFSRIPSANSYDDFSATTTNEKYCAISTITNAAATDYYNVIGRFAATLSAGAGYTWSVPTYTAKNLIQRPIYETRLLNWNPVYSASGSMTYTSVTTAVARYKIRGEVVEFLLHTTAGTTGGTTSKGIISTLPFTANATSYDYIGAGVIYDNDNGNSSSLVQFNATNLNQVLCIRYDDANITLGTSRQIDIRGVFEI